MVHGFTFSADLENLVNGRRVVHASATVVVIEDSAAESGTAAISCRAFLSNAALAAFEMGVTYIPYGDEAASHDIQRDVRLGTPEEVLEFRKELAAKLLTE